MTTGNPPEFDHNKKIVALLGSSSTAGKGQAFDWIRELRQRPSNGLYQFRNFGVGGDLAYNALQRLPPIIADRPEIVVVWIGGNDALALASVKAKRFFQTFKRLPVNPSSDWFRQDIEIIAHRLKNETTARVAFCSLPPIGEDLSARDSFQGELNERVEECNDAIRALAVKETIGYIPLHEAHRLAPAKAFSSFRFLPFYRDAFRTLILGKNPDQVAEMNAWFLHTDGVHLNSRGGLIAADLVQAFIDQHLTNS